MKLTLKLAHDDQEYTNRVSALKILNKFAQDMGQTLCECFIHQKFDKLQQKYKFNKIKNRIQNLEVRK